MPAPEGIKGLHANYKLHLFVHYSLFLHAPREAGGLSALLRDQATDYAQASLHCMLWHTCSESSCWAQQRCAGLRGCFGNPLHSILMPFCATCKASLPMEDKHDKDALANRCFCEFCAPFPKHMLEKRLSRSSLPHHPLIERWLRPPPMALCQERADNALSKEAVLTVFFILLCLSFSSSVEEEEESLVHAIGRLRANGTVLLKLLCEHSAPSAPPVPLGTKGAARSDWQQDDALSIATSKELAFLSEDVESDSTSPAVRLSLSAELMALIKRATAVLQVPWCTECEARQSIFNDEPATSPTSPSVHPDFLFEIQSSWGHPATAPAVSQSMDTLYRVHDAEKLGLAQFPPVNASIAVSVQAPNLALLSKDSICPNKQCRVSEVILKRAYLASAFAAWLGNFNSILVAYQSHLLLLSDNHRPSPLQLDELCLVLASVHHGHLGVCYH
ncbi:UNVERIFIED_CONTAM: hypothetical protein FKN15_038372 [Acipenser sinensis]